MNTELHGYFDDAEEISSLVSTLIDAEERLQALTLGQVDSVSDSTGRTYVFRHAQEQLRTSEVERQIAVLNALPSHIALLDIDGFVISVNEAWKQFAANNAMASDHAGVGLNYLNVCDKVVGKDSVVASAVSAGIRSVLTGQEKNFWVEYVVETPTENRWFLLNVSPLSGMRRKRAIVMHLDVTERKRVEEALLRSEERFRSMLQNVELAAKIIDRKGDVTFGNDYLLRVLELPSEDIVGSNWISKFIPESGHAEARISLDTMLADGLPTQRESDVVSKSGATHQILWNAAVVRDQLGEVSGIASIGANITERKSLQRQFMQSQKMEAIGSLAGAIAHDFNNLLTGMLGYTELAQLRLPKDSPVQDDLLEVRASAERGANLIKQLLSFAREEDGDPQVINTSQLVDDLSNLIKSLLGARISLRIERCEDAARIRLDSSHFEQLVINLSVNARDAMPRGGLLTIATATKELDSVQVVDGVVLRPGAYVILSVSDSGSGMTKAVQDRVFDPFFTTKERGKGTGLGLSTCHGIVTNGGGQISLSSEVNVGTTFTIYFPRVDDPETLHKTKEEPVLALNGETVLIVDDQDSVRSLAAEILTMMGYRVLCANDGPSALMIAQSEGAIDLLLTDIEMPGMTGAELAKEIVLSIPEIKLLFMSGFTSNQDLKVQAEIQKSFLQKPFSASQLSRKVWQVLNAVAPHVQIA